MSSPEPNRPQGGLTKGQKYALPAASAGMFLILFAPLVLLFPNFPLRFPMYGALLVLIGATATLDECKSAVDWRRLAGMGAFVNLTVLAVALLVATLQQAAGCTEPEWVGVAVGTVATMPVGWLATQRIIRIMTRRGDDARDDGEGPA